MVSGFGFVGIQGKQFTFDGGVSDFAHSYGQCFLSNSCRGYEDVTILRGDGLTSAQLDTTEYVSVACTKYNSSAEIFGGDTLVGHVKSAPQATVRVAVAPPSLSAFRGGKLEFASRRVQLLCECIWCYLQEIYEAIADSPDGGARTIYIQSIQRDIHLRQSSKQINLLQGLRNKLSALMKKVCSRQSAAV